jgi:lipoprotein-anchoring transpeptidase ErfK/SrfK
VLSLRSRYLLLVVLVLVALGVFAGGVYAYDQAHQDKIAKGVTVGGVPVGGLTPDQARARLKAQILDPLRRPIVVHRSGERWRLGPKQARIATDLDATVDEAMARSHEGSILERVWRQVRGQRVDARLEPTVTYSKAAVRRLLTRVSTSVDRDPRDAKVSIDGSGVASVPSHPGRKVRTAVLGRRIRAAITDPGATRSFSARTTPIAPKVTTADLKKKYGTVIIVNRSAFRLTLYKDLKVSRTYPIAVGQVGLETPAGLYSIANKAVNPAWHVPNSAWAGSLAGQVIPGDDPSNPIKARWLGVYDGVGVHGTSDDASIGSAASHGCIRMHIPDVIDLYDRVPVGAPIYIA